MRAAQLLGPRDTRVVSVQRPVPGPGEILVRVRAVAICPSDLRLWDDGHAAGTYPDHPFVQGHEFSGEVAELGEGVRGPAVGTPVAITPLWACGTCDLCREGLSNICRNIVFPSFPQTDGAMQEYMVVPAWSVQPLPEGMGFVEGALIEPLQAAVHGFGLTHIEPGWPVAVVGAGIIGLGVLQVAKANGAQAVYVADPVEENRRLALEFGATEVAPLATDFVSSLSDLSRQPHVVFECSGHPAALGQAMQLCRPAGEVVIIGVPHPDVIELDTVPPRRKELHFVFSRRYKVETLKQTVDLLATGRVSLSGYRVRTFPLEQAADAMSFAHGRPAGVLRTVVVCD